MVYWSQMAVLFLEHKQRARRWHTPIRPWRLVSFAVNWLMEFVQKCQVLYVAKEMPSPACRQRNVKSCMSSKKCQVTCRTWHFFGDIQDLTFLNPACRQRKVKSCMWPKKCQVLHVVKEMSSPACCQRNVMSCMSPKKCQVLHVVKEKSSPACRQRNVKSCMSSKTCQVLHVVKEKSSPACRQRNVKSCMSSKKSQVLYVAKEMSSPACRQRNVKSCMLSKRCQVLHVAKEMSSPACRQRNVKSCMSSKKCQVLHVVKEMSCPVCRQRNVSSCMSPPSWWITSTFSRHIRKIVDMHMVDSVKSSCLVYEGIRVDRNPFQSTIAYLGRKQTRQPSVLSLISVSMNYVSRFWRTFIYLYEIWTYAVLSRSATAV